MQLARVIGEVVATVKDANLTGSTLLVLQPIDAAGEDVGRTLVALDSVGAGVGERVFFVRGREAAFPFYPAEPPADAAIVGIVDHWDRRGRGDGEELVNREVERCFNMVKPVLKRSSRPPHLPVDEFSTAS